MVCGASWLVVALATAGAADATGVPSAAATTDAAADVVGVSLPFDAVTAVTPAGSVEGAEVASRASVV
jgi:hypothetical protein